jgi:hypothetical protein
MAAGKIEKKYSNGRLRTRSAPSAGQTRRPRDQLFSLCSRRQDLTPLKESIRETRRVKASLRPYRESVKSVAGSYHDVLHTIEFVAHGTIAH